MDEDPQIGEQVTIAYSNNGSEQLVTRKVTILYYCGECVETGELINFGPEEVLVREDDQPQTLEG